MSAAARKSKTQLIHVAAKSLGLDREVYEAVLVQATGKASCKLMTLAEMDAALVEFRRRGWKKTAGSKAMRYGRTPMGKKIRKLWQVASREKSETSLRAMIRRVLGLADTIIPDPDLLSVKDAAKVIEAIKDMAGREAPARDRGGR